MSVANTDVLIFNSELLNERDYWTERLLGVSATSSLPMDCGGLKDGSGARSVFKFSLADSVFRDLVKLTGESPFLKYTALLGAVKICLHKYSGRKTILVGSPALKELGRPNLLAIVSELDDETSFRQFLLGLRDRLLDAYAHQNYPFNYLIRDLKLESPAGTSPLFDLVVMLKDMHGDLPDLSSDLTLTLENRADRISGFIQYNPGLYSRETIDVFANHLRSVVGEALGNKDQRLGDFKMLTAGERQRVTTEWNQTENVYSPLCLHQIFENQVERSPHAVALHAGETQLTYAELNSKANELAHFLSQQGVGPEVPVGICMERSVEMVVAVLAVLKAGGAYVPLDAGYPLARLQHVIEEINPPVILTQAAVAERLPAHWGQVVCLDEESARLGSFPKTNPETNVQPENSAYVIYTSGSTGRPKGVIVPHAGLGNVAAAQSGILGIQPNSRVLQFASLSFDASIFELLMAWGSGGQVCLMPQNTLPLGRDLRQLLIDYRVTTVTLPPTALATLPVDEFPDLSTITVAGEACATGLVERWGPSRRFFNLYGPTEATIWSTAAECFAGNGKPRIGKPIDNVATYILDERMEPVPIGVAGELYVGGVGLARGYWGLPELTAEKFVPHPFSAAAGARLYRTGDLARFRADGQIDFLGRLDEQVKLRGFRIELGEIEAVLKQHAGVQDAVVIVREDKPDDKRIVAYFVSQQEQPPTAGELLSLLQQKLPDFMMPQAFVAIDQVPLTPNGKVDRRLLMAPDTGRPDLEEAFVEPSGETEQALARIWSAVLRVERIGAHDNFFALGGDSILAMQVAARSDEAGLRLLPRHIFQHQTIAELALIAGTALPIQAEQGLVTGPVPLTPVQSWFFEQNLPDAHHYNQSVMLAVQDKLDLSSWERLVQHLLRHHDALRMRYRRHEPGWQQFNAEPGEAIPFEYFDLSALPEGQHTEFIEQKANALQASLNLVDGPLLRVALFDPGLGQASRVLVVIHHLVVDGVSFRIILEHLQTGYEQALQGEPIDFGKKTTSFKYWAESLTDYARAEALETEQPYWLRMASTEVSALPVDCRDGANSIESARRIQVSLGAEETRALLQEVPAAYHTQINDVLLTAVAQAFHAWTGEPSLLISLEGHGREEISEDIDLSRTVGWFTTEFPVLLTLDGARSEFQALPIVKEQLRSIPQRGIGYGLLRYLGEGAGVGEQLRQLPRPEVSFNYLGQFDQVLHKSGLFGIARESKGRTQSERGQLPYLIQINGSIIADSLQLTWTYSENIFSRTTVERLADRFLISLRALIAHCQSPEAGGFTPSDFPLAHVTQSELDQVVGSHKQIEDVYPLSPFQQGLLFHTLFTPEVDVYFTQLTGTIEQQLDAGSLKRAVQRVIDRHPILRTAFVWEGPSEPLQVVHKQVELPWQELDWRTLPVSQQEAELEAFLKADRQRDFVFSEAPIMRCTLVRLGEDNYRFIWSFHHLLLDGWALFQVAKEAFAFYDAFVEGSELSLATSRPFRDYIGWLQKQDRSAAETFWRAALKGFAAPTPLAVERPSDERAAFEENYHDQRLRLSSETTEALQSIARQHQLTLNTIVQGLYGLLLSRYSGEGDVVFGAVVAGRPATLVGVESMIGIFINTVPARVRIAPEQGVLAWLKQLQEQQVEAQEYDHSPLAQVQGWSDVPKGQPLFESVLVFENYPVDASLSQPRASLSLKDVKSFDRANYPLTIGASPGRELLFRFSYDRRRFDDEAITRMFGHLETMLAAVAAHPEMCLADVPLLTSAERQQVMVDWNQTTAQFAGEVCLHQLFEAQVERCPQAVAVHAGDQQLSYAELNERANRLAHFLREQGVGPEVLVGVCLERSLEMVVALLAVLKAGGAYVPLDPAYPLERLRYMMEEINAWVVLTQTSVAERLPAHWGQVICLDDEFETFESFPAANPGIDVGGDNLANLIFTSGSLGAPKATMVTHRGLHNTILSRVEALSLTAADRVLQTTSFSFDASVWEFFAPLAIGARLVMLQPGQHQRPAEIVGMLAEHRVTTVQLPPSWLQMVLQERGLNHCEHLRHVVCGGEIITGDLKEQFFDTVQANLHNFYGPTETSIDATSWTCQPGGAKRAAPIGRPIANVQVYILDAQLRPVPVGVKGELHIGGVGLARGYLNQPHTTAEKFIPNPFGETPGSRLYKTGDVARYLADGNIEFCGRNDDQLKIRGFRIEPGEIEAVLVQHEKVLEAVVIAQEDNLGNKRLVAYVGMRHKPQPTFEELRAFVAGRLPAHMVPAFFVMLEALPRNLNGKVDRPALPAPDQSRPELDAPYVAPRNSIEETLAAIWVQVLGVERVGIDDNFFALGGDSIRSVQVLSKAQQQGLSFSLQDIFQEQTIRRLSQEIATVEVGTEPKPETQPFSLISLADRQKLPADIEDAYPLTILQAGMIFHTDYRPESAVYHSISSRRIRAKLDIEALRRAIDRIVEQHQVLRTSFHLQGFSEPLQLVHRSVRVPVSEDDLRRLEPGEQERLVSEWLEIEKIRPFDWSNAPLLRVHVHRYTDATFQFTFTSHHSILDGWSDSIVFAELFKRYVALLKGEPEPETLPPSIPYREFVWLERQALASEESRGFWKDKLRGHVAGRLPRRSDNNDGASKALRQFVIPVSSALSDGLKQITQITGIPIKDVLLTAHLKIMSFLSGRRDVTTGLVSNGRPEATDGERIVGLFLNTLPFRVRLPEGSWIDLISKVFATEKEILPHRRYPLARIQRDQGGQSLFETAFNFTQFHLYQELRDTTDVEVLDSISVAETNFTLMANFAVAVTTNRILALIDCNGGDVSEEQVRAIGGYYAKTLEAMAADPYASHEGISLLNDLERHQLLSGWNSTQERYEGDRTVAELFEAQVERTPDAAAVMFEHEVLSYRELNRRANQVAHYLRSLGVAPEIPVAICLERGLEMVISVLAVVKAGGAYVPIDPADPRERVEYLLRDADARVLMTKQYPEEGFSNKGVTVVSLERDREKIEKHSFSNCEPLVSGDNLVYVIYTSGSTGLPKGAMNTHAGLRNRLLWMQQQYGLDETDRVLQKTPYTFDVSGWEFFWPLLAGSCLIVARPEGHRDCDYLNETIRRFGVTTIHFVPPMLRTWLAYEGAGRCTSLKRVFSSGEALDREAVNRFHSCLAADLHNLYGPTEASIDVTYWFCRPDWDQNFVPIGRPIANTEIYILDEFLQPLPVGVAGELYIGGAGLARGYLGRPDITAERFIPDPFADRPGARIYKTGDLARYLPSGDLVFMERLDEQVKVRGFRIELGEIEATLGQHSLVRDVVVQAPVDDSGERRLVAYVVTDLEAGAAVAELRSYLKEKLPAYMVPQGFILMPQLPLTPNGKIDRRGLPSWKTQSEDRDESSPTSRMPVEDLLAGIWSEVLRMEQVQVEDNFFELGGDSLLATQVISRVRENFRAEVPLRSLFENPTLAGFGAAVQAALRNEQGLAAPPIRPSSRDVELPLSFAQQRLWIVDQLVRGAPVYNLPAAVRLRGELNIGALEQSLNELIRRHESLRTTFAVKDGRPIQIIAPSLNLPLELLDLSDLPEVTRETEARQVAGEWLQTPFDLRRGPLVRAQLLRLAPEEHVALFVIHHIISDGWSMGVLINEIATLYDAFTQARPSPLPELPIQYADFAAWQREWLQGEVLDLQLDYWRKQLGNKPPELLLPLDRQRPPVQTHNGTHQPFSVSAKVQQGLSMLSRREGVTMFMTLLAAFQTLLYRYSSQEDVVIGTDLANRNRAETERVIGFFVNMLVLRTSLSGNPSFRELLGRVRDVALGAYAHQDLPFERLVDELEQDRDPSRNPLFQAVFVLQNTPAQDLKLGGISLSPFPIQAHTVQFDLILSLSEGKERMAGVFAYNTDLFDGATITEMVNRFQNLLQLIVEDPDQHLDDFRLISNAAASGFSPTDFPRANLSQKDFENLLGQLSTTS